MEHDRFVLRAVTDEVMYEIMNLSGQEYVDMYATAMKRQLTEAAKAEKEAEKAAKAALARAEKEQAEKEKREKEKQQQEQQERRTGP
jgi:1-acyl-sn-glycerol-3-phosphate acyltransferase